MQSSRVTIVVTGHVQGVGFRWFTEERAARRGLSGTVRNRPDGCVEAIVEGPRALLLELIEDLRRGPTAARVENLEAVWGAPLGLDSGFRIIG